MIGAMLFALDNFLKRFEAICGLARAKSADWAGLALQTHSTKRFSTTKPICRALNILVVCLKIIIFVEKIFLNMFTSDLTSNKQNFLDNCKTKKCY
jgi:hypothetical protein